MGLFYNRKSRLATAIGLRCEPSCLYSIESFGRKRVNSPPAMRCRPNPRGARDILSLSELPRPIAAPVSDETGSGVAIPTFRRRSGVAMTNLLGCEQRNNLLRNGFTRRDFARLAAFAA